MQGTQGIKQGPNLGQIAFYGILGITVVSIIFFMAMIGFGGGTGNPDPLNTPRPDWGAKTPNELGLDAKQSAQYKEHVQTYLDNASKNGFINTSSEYPGVVEGQNIQRIFEFQQRLSNGNASLNEAYKLVEELYGPQAASSAMQALPNGVIEFFRGGVMVP